jgi:flagellar protein FliO/FliZ
MNSVTFAAQVLNPISQGWLDYAKTLLVLGAILILAFVAVRFWIPRLAGFRTLSSEHIEVFARYSLEPRKTLYVVRAGKTMILLASSEQGVQFMTALEPDDFESNGAGQQMNEGSFSRLLKSFKTRKIG